VTGLAKILYPDFFNDVFGPIMQPGSSSCFAGTCRVGRIARCALKSPVKRVRILFGPKSRDFETLGNMMEDWGYLGGLLNLTPEDVRLFDAHKLARDAKISYAFEELTQDNGLPGSVHFELTGQAGDTATLTAKSVGGGMVTTYDIHGFDIAWQGDTFGLLVFGEEADLTGCQAALIKKLGIDLISISIHSRPDGKTALFFETASPHETSDITAYFGPQAEVRVLPALLPVITTNDRRPQLFKTVQEWREEAAERNISFVQAAIAYEKDFSGWEEARIWEYFENIASILHRQIHSLEECGYENAKDTLLLPIYGRQWHAYEQTKTPLSDTLTRQILTRAFSVNAKLPGFLIVPGPMGTGGGYLFSALESVQAARGYSHKMLVEGLVIAAALGALAYTHCRASGESGCVGESGVCCAMASGAICHMAGGTGEMVERAASMALQANLGIPCDPIPGGLEFPCITRTLRAAVTAPMYADLALCGMDPLVPYHEVLAAIEQSRVSLGEGVNGPRCGINCTETSCRFQAHLRQEVMGDKMRYEAE
jgi:L-serine dehydratase